MPERNRCGTLALVLRSLVMGVLLVICSGTANAVLQTENAAAIATGFALAYISTQYLSMRAAHALTGSPDYKSAMYTALLNMGCMVLSFMGVRLYGFVVILSLLCEAATVYYICQGTNALLRALERRKLPVLGSLLWKGYALAEAGCAAVLLVKMPDWAPLTASIAAVAVNLGIVIYLHLTCRALQACAAAEQHIES